jgi:CheY-like chemotaxis protein
VLTALISDDDPQVLAMLARHAHMYGLAVIRDGDSRAVALSKLQPQVILLDLNQRLSGRELLAAIKADPGTRDIPVVVMTGGDEGVARGQCLGLGAAEFVTKPFDASFMARVFRLATLRDGGGRGGGNGNGR